MKIMTTHIALLLVCLAGGCAASPDAAEDSQEIALCPTPACAFQSIRSDLATVAHEGGLDVSAAVASVSATESLVGRNAPLAAIEHAFDQSLDSISDLSEEQQLRLQLAMDRRDKIFEMLSNILKKLSSTEQQIISNIK
jgi:hypothetical protein